MVLGSTAGESSRTSPSVVTAGSDTSEIADALAGVDVGQRPFMDVEHRVARAVARQAVDRLGLRHHLAGLGHALGDDAVGVGAQLGVGELVLRRPSSACAWSSCALAERCDASAWS